MDNLVTIQPKIGGFRLGDVRKVVHSNVTPNLFQLFSRSKMIVAILEHFDITLE